jgi:2-haloacid dehalogenase
MAVLGFDVFGTLVDPSGIAEPVRPFAGERTDALVGEWRRTQLEYAFRRAAMNAYQPFDRVTRAALDHAITVTPGIGDISDAERERLVAAWTALPAFADAPPALEALRARGHRCLAFSNGTAAGLQALMSSTGLDVHLDDVISVEAVGTYKPAPAVYDHLVERGGIGQAQTWLVSGNAWDVIGARSAGLRAAWLQRDPGKPFDPWDEAPDLVVESLTALANAPDILSS